MVNDATVTLVAAFEGLRLVAYVCPAGVWTIGYGHTSAAGSPVVVPGMRMSSAEARAVLERDLATVAAGVRAAVTVPLTPNQLGALTSFAFNVGLGAFRKSSLLRRLNRREYDAVPLELRKWTRGGGKVLPGLVRRRAAEAALWGTA